LRHSTVAFVGLLTVLTGCWPGQSEHSELPIPAGAQTVRVSVTESALVLDPATVRAGDVYLVLDNDLSGDRDGYHLVTFVPQDSGETPDPLPDVDSQLLAGCAAEERDLADGAPNGALGYCGANVVMVTLGEGKYTFVVRGEAFLRDEPNQPSEWIFVRASGGSAPPMAVLEVLP
jgi:hypothetical protein